MKTILLLYLCLISSLARSEDYTIKCTLVPANGGNFPFIKVNGDKTDSNSDLHSIEKKVFGNVVFLLKQGHGILRLEAYKRNNFVASSLVQEANLTNKTTMNLQILAKLNMSVETFCNNLLVP